MEVTGATTSKPEDIEMALDFKRKDPEDKTMNTAINVSKPEKETSSGLCGTELTGCRQRSEYAVFLLEGGSTVQKVLAYVEPPECLGSSSCDWTGG